LPYLLLFAVVLGQALRHRLHLLALADRGAVAVQLGTRTVHRVGRHLVAVMDDTALVGPLVERRAGARRHCEQQAARDEERDRGAHGAVVSGRGVAAAGMPGKGCKTTGFHGSVLGGHHWYSNAVRQVMTHDGSASAGLSPRIATGTPCQRRLPALGPNVSTM